MPAGVLDPSPTTSARPGLRSRVRRWGVAALAVAQLVAVAVATASGSRPLSTGGSGSASGSGSADLLLTPAGWALAVWGVVVVGCLACAVHQLPAGRGDEPAHRRVARPLAGVMAGSVAWFVAAAAAPVWVALAVLVVVLALLVLAYDTALRHRRLLRLPGRLLLLGTLGAYTGWAAVAVPVELAAALAAAGLPTTGAAGAAWQAGVLLLALAAGVAVVHRWRARAASTLAAVWGLLAVAFGAGSHEGGALLAAVAAVGGVALLGWAVWSRWEDLRRRVEASTVRLRRGPVV